MAAGSVTRMSSRPLLLKFWMSSTVAVTLAAVPPLALVTRNVAVALGLRQLKPNGSRSVITTSPSSGAGVEMLPVRFSAVDPPGAAPRVPNDLNTPSCGALGSM